MIEGSKLLGWLTEKGFYNYVGVPDSALSPLVHEIESSSEIHSHVVAANEGAAVGYAIGVFIETGRPAVVYMQNSGLGNALNPLAALAHPSIFGIPMLMIIGWRGKPGDSDEPQHEFQGRITPELLNLLEIPFLTLNGEAQNFSSQISGFLAETINRAGPSAILVPPRMIRKIENSSQKKTANLMRREEALAEVMQFVRGDDRLISATGMLSRELWEFTEMTPRGQERLFMAVGGMGHVSSIAHGVASVSSKSRVWCFDGDGSLIMHMGTMGVIGKYSPNNFRHVIFNNLAHDSVGGQETAATAIDFAALAHSLGYKWAASVKSKDELRAEMSNFLETKGPSLLEIRIRTGHRIDLARPPKTVFRSNMTWASIGD